MITLILRLSYRYARLTSACHKKCISTKYREPDLMKGEAVCVDRCVSKYLEIHERIGNTGSLPLSSNCVFQARS